ncbi:alpha/beta-hydrolase [Massarina eburnea CBS 473.64]|uniref:Alpha/beta-hydrolase n=1 Tax=Massarina eburnea CBS 473.64 TaxID=1395130 RepID=A0A6A6SDD2_9PLEO|nr:alpha/beta-hydrolase [Massarina eburnea CBS 473.64]
MTPTKPYGTLPPGASKSITPFEIHVSDEQFSDFKTLLRLSPIAKPSYENQESRKPQNLGVTRDWVIQAKTHWQETYDWRKEEAYINSFPQYIAEVQDDDGRTIKVHFLALFSEKEGAIPVVQSHGWPSTFAEFIPECEMLRKKYSPQTLPYHMIIPSLPGWCFSDAPPLDRDWKYEDSARILHKLMLALGFGKTGYAGQGGDIGAGVVRNMAARYPECKALHLNFSYINSPPFADDVEAQLEDVEKKGLERLYQFGQTGNAYGKMHGTRTSTIGQVLSSSPLALMSWIGEKYLEWVDPEHPISLNTILTEVSLFWFSGCAGTSLYPYREDYLWGIYQPTYLHGQEHLYVSKKFGFSYFPKDISAIPKAWMEKTGTLGWFKRHESGGHFPALERTSVLLEDLEVFLGDVWE